MECTALICPIGTVSQGGVCTILIEDMTGYSINIALQIELDSNTDPVDIDYEELADDMLRLFKRNVHRDKIRCGFCELTLYDSSALGTLFIMSSFVTTKLCSASDLLRGIYMLLPTTSDNIILQNTNISPTFRVLEVETFLEIKRNTLANRYNSHCIGGIVFDPIESVYCPSIHLNHDDMREFTYHDNAVSLILSNSVDIGNGTLRICMEEYISVLKRTQLISGQNPRYVSNMLIGIGMLLARICN